MIDTNACLLPWGKAHRPLTSYEVIVETIGTVTTKSGLTAMEPEVFKS